MVQYTLCRLFDTLANVVSQGNVRRGYFSAYLPIEHPDADEFLDIGTEGNPIQGLDDRDYRDLKNLSTV